MPTCTYRRSGLVALALLACGSLSAQADVLGLKIPEHSATKPVPHAEGAADHKRYKALVKKADPELIFLGDSITRMYRKRGRKTFDKYYARRKALNCGTNGDRTQHILWRLDDGELDHASPKVIVLLAGTNNSKSNSPKEIADGVTAIVQRIRLRLPETRILVMGIFPRGKTADDPTRKTILAANDLIKNIADNKMIHFMDLRDAFLSDGKLKGISYDGVHPSEEGYEIWAAAIEPTLARLLGEE